MPGRPVHTILDFGGVLAGQPELDGVPCLHCAELPNSSATLEDVEAATSDVCRVADGLEVGTVSQQSLQRMLRASAVHADEPYHEIMAIAAARGI